MTSRFEITRRHLLLEMKAGAFPSSAAHLRPHSSVVARRDTPLRPSFISFKIDPSGGIISCGTAAVESDGRREVCLRPELQRGMETYLVRVPSDS